MKSSRFQKEYRASASKLHQRVGDVLRASPIFNGYNIYQEYSVQQILPSYSNARHHYDWCIPEIQLLIECQGQQHEHPVTFGGISKEEAQTRYLQQKTRDKQKMDAAVEAEYTYITVDYNDYDKITDTYIYNLWKQYKNDTLLPEKVKPQKLPQKILDKARDFRQKCYLKMKELKNARRTSNQ